MQSPPARGRGLKRLLIYEVVDAYREVAPRAVIDRPGAATRSGRCARRSLVGARERPGAAASTGRLVGAGTESGRGRFAPGTGPVIEPAAGSRSASRRRFQRLRLACFPVRVRSRWCAPERQPPAHSSNSTSRILLCTA